MGNGILVICEHEAGRFKKTAFELLGKACELADALSTHVDALVIGQGDAAGLGSHGARVAWTVTGEAFGTYNTGPAVRAIQAAVAAADPAYILAPASPAMRDALPRLSARLGAGMVTEVTALRVDGGTIVGRRPMVAGKASADVTVRGALAVITVRPNSFPVGPGGAGTAEVRPVAVTLQPGDDASRVVGRETASTSVVDLTEADRIVSGGRAVKSSDGFDKLIRTLAAAIGATPGASRAAVDAGFAPHSAQVGQTGKVVNPSLYFACGISGAIQHLAGMRTSRIIVAINTDPEAPIFQFATYGIVGDIFEVCPKLASRLEAALR